MAGRDALSLRIEGDAADGGGVRQGFQRGAPGVQHMHRLGDGRGADATLMRRDMLHPFAAEFGELGGGAVGCHAHHAPVIAAAQRAILAVGAEREAGAAMRRHRHPIGRCLRKLRDSHRAVAEPRMQRAPLPPEGEADDPGAQRVRGAALAEQEFHIRRVTHAWQPSKPRRSCGRFRSRPMKTILDLRGSPSFQGPI